MTRTAIVKGVARWYGKNVVPRIPAFSLEKAGHATAVLMAEKNPAMAETLLMNLVQPGVASMVQTLVAAAQDDAMFDLAVSSLREVVAKEAVQFPTPGKGPNPDGSMNLLSVGPADIAIIVGEIRTAQQEIDNAAALAKANAQDTQTTGGKAP